MAPVLKKNARRVKMKEGLAIWGCQVFGIAERCIESRIF